MSYNEQRISNIKQIYSKGTRIKLNYMHDKWPVPSGTCGTVMSVDDAGTIHVKWDNGSSLGLIYGEDSFEVIKDGI